MFEKLFGWGKKKEAPATEIPFGRYSDNNKPLAKVNRWTDADSFFKEKRYPEGLDAFFDYLRDDIAQNVTYERNGNDGKFQIFQGSKIVRGVFDGERVRAEVTLAKMPQPSVPVMRRLLEMNFSLYYSRFALDNDRLCMRFDSNIDAANPSKLYYGLKELATKGDKQDDLLVQDFSVLQTTDDDHIIPITDKEKEIKFDYLQRWLSTTLDLIATLDADKFSGGIAYMLLALVYRIDYLVTPEGKLLNDLERIAGIYFKKDERPATEKNRDMIEEFRKLQGKSKEEIFTYLFRSRYTFSIVAPQSHRAITDSITAANQSMVWYRDNSYPQIGTQVTEYGVSYCQYSYSLPKAITDLFSLYMQVNYNDYYLAIGYRDVYYDATRNQLDSQAIIDRIKAIQERWKEKYPQMDFKIANLRFDNLINFGNTFTTELALLNMDGK
jgi:hypothetical protein